MRTLITGGVRSGKSRHAESLLPTDGEVVYVAPGNSPEAEEDPDWSARIASHQARRPTAWRTVETRDLAAAVHAASAACVPVIVDCLGTWLTAVIDERGLWEASSPVVTEVIEHELDALLEALTDAQCDVVLVTNEVGLGVVPAHRSGRLFRDLLGLVNQRVATGCDEVRLVIAGRVLFL